MVVEQRVVNEGSNPYTVPSPHLTASSLTPPPVAPINDARTEASTSTSVDKDAKDNFQPNHRKQRSFSSSDHSSNIHTQLVTNRPPKPTPNKPRSRSSVVPRSKLRQTSFSGDTAGSKPLSTHSPIALAAAAAVTGDKIRKLLVAQGPLPIRHITSHLAATIPGFGELSLSKQRRLIIAVLDAPKSEFVKVGWGRWSVTGDGVHGGNRSDSLGGNRAINNGFSGSFGGSGVHRESISRNLPDSKPPLSPSLGPVDGSAVFSDSDSDDSFDEDSEVEGTDEEDWQAIGPTQLRQTSPREQDAIAALVQLRSN